MINKDDLSLRSFSIEDVEHVLNDWYRADPKYLEALNVDPKRMLPEDEHKKFLLEEASKNESISTYLTVLYKGKAVGIHLINQIKPKESGVFHAHLWADEFRGLGISTITYPMACKIFFERLGLKKIIFRTPVNNSGAIRIKEKLGMRFLSEEILNGAGIIKDGTQVRIFELLPSDL